MPLFGHDKSGLIIGNNSSTTEPSGRQRDEDLRRQPLDEEGWNEVLGRTFPTEQRPEDPAPMAARTVRPRRRIGLFGRKAA